MKLYLDQIELKAPRPSLASALETARGAALSAGRVIIEAALDGRALSDQELSDPSDAPLAGELRLISTEPRALVRTTLGDVADALGQVRDAQSRAAELLQGGDLPGALDHLRQVVTVWDHVRRVSSEGPALLGVDIATLDASRPEHQRLAPHVPGLMSLLGQLRDALSAQDWSTLADLLSVELDDAAGTWETLLRSLAESLGSRAG